ncbi:T9SS type A sorting domain-containing protein [Arcicella rigui]|uniref:T9SS type A sorting domain-containing protein n=1 Tax=Arcicella rigui TaxID=797020 RepID=A0ABU5Q7V9_9BACT|nr:T9SS type A sorting domain-containing protein [Arcicella rigui]MEA5138926.1 T9SS type A sorting domain-containing protein [Arcicella rigui]
MKRICTSLLLVWLILSYSITSAQTTPTITATGVYTCTGQGTSQLTLPTGYAVYQWLDANNVAVGSSQTYLASPGTYTAKVKKNVGDASFTNVAAFTVTSIVPTAPVLTAPSDIVSPVCATASRSLTASGGSNYTWFRDNVSLGVSTSTLNVTGTSVSTAGTYVYTVSSTNSVTGCSTLSSSSVSLKVSPKPTTPVIASVSNDLVCGTATQTLTATSGGTSYTWKREGTSLNTSTTNSLSVKGTDVSTAGVYDFTVVSQNAVGCTSDESAVVSLKLSPKPTTPVIASVSNDLVCGTATQTLTATSGGTSYTWKREGTSLNTSTTNSLSVKGTDVSTAGVYDFTVVLQNSVGCTSDESAVVSLKLSPKPTTPVIAPLTSNLLCGTETKTLTATSGATAYTWKRSGTSLANTTNTLTIALADVATAGIYSYSVIAQNSVGCLSDESATVKVVLSPKPAKPVIDALNITDPICGVGTKTLTATSGGAYYTWKRNTTVLSDTISTLLVKGNDVLLAGTYNYSVTLENSFGCVSDESSAVALKVSPKPATPTISPITKPLVCGTDSRTLTASSGGAAYIWYRGDKLLKSTSSAITVTGRDTTVGGNYTFTVALQNSVGCASDYSTGVTLQLYPTVPSKPNITASGKTTFCEGGSVTLTSSYTASSNVWSRTSGADTTTVLTTGIKVLKTNTFIVKAKDANGCLSLASDSVKVTVNANPTAPIIAEGTSVSVCQLDSIKLNANNKGTGSYLWNTGAKTRSIYVKTAGNYSVAYTDSNTCVSPTSALTVLKVNPLPAKPTVTAVRPVEFCAGDFTTLRGSTASGYIWSNGATTSEITVTSSASITLRVVSDKGCKSKDSSDVVTVISNPLPATPSIVANGPLKFCPDSTVTLTSSATQSKYVWTELTSKTVLDSTKSLVVGDPGVYALQVISAKKCISKVSTSVTVSVREAPQPASILASPTAIFCEGGSVTLKALFANGNVEKYSWRNEDTKLEVATAQEFTVKSSGKFSVKVRDSFGCFSAYSKVTKVTVNPLPTKPTIRLVRPVNFCDEDSTVLEASLPNTTPNDTKNKNVYQWSIDGKVFQTGNVRVLTWKKASNITVAITDTNGCKAVSSSDVVTTVVNPLPATPSITIIGANPFCADRNIILNAIGVEASTYKWSISNSDKSTISVNKAGNVTVQSVSALGCLSKPSPAITLSTYPLPAAPQISVTSGSTVFCDGNKVRFTSSSTNKAYWWKSSTDSLGVGDSNTSLTASVSGNYFARVQDKNTCLSAPSNSIAVDVRPLPTVPEVSQAGTYTLDAQSNGDENGYVWKYNSEVQKAFTSRVIKVKKDGDYQVQASITYSIASLPSGKLVCYSNASSVFKYKQDVSFDGMSIYPNPSITGDVTIEVVEDLVGSTLQVFTMEGKLVEEFKIDKFDGPKKVTLSGSTGNAYIVKLKTDSFEKIKKIIVLK